MKLGVMQTLVIRRFREFGAYLGDDTPQGEREGAAESVLLPKKEVPEGAAAGDRVEVFLYKDSAGRPIATTRRPLITVGEVGRLAVKEVTKIGAFLDMGLERDVLLPYHEMQGEVRPGGEVLAALYVDRSGRLAATMRVYRYLKPAAEGAYSEGQEVSGTVYGLGDPGVFVAVDDRYFGLIPKSEVYGDFRPGQAVSARILRVRPDGKLDLSPRKKAWQQMGDDAERILKALETSGGRLALGDKSDPEDIRRTLGLSKNAFKRAAGQLLKAGKIEISDDSICAAKKSEESQD